MECGEIVSAFPKVSGKVSHVKLIGGYFLNSIKLSTWQMIDMRIMTSIIHQWLFVISYGKVLRRITWN